MGNGRIQWHLAFVAAFEDDITVTFVRMARSVRLFGYFKKKGIQVDNPYPGIYYVEGFMFATQIVVTTELRGDSHIWLKTLSGKLDTQDMEELIERTEQLDDEYDRELADSVLEVSVRANKEVVKEIRKGDDDMCKALFEILEPDIIKIVEERAAAIAVLLLNSGRMDA